jgi:hypothetical protein
MQPEVIHWLSGMPWFGWIAMVAIVCGCVSGIIQMRHKHIERMEMIRHGMNPDGGKPYGTPEV